MLIFLGRFMKETMRRTWHEFFFSFIGTLLCLSGDLDPSSAGSSDVFLMELAWVVDQLLCLEVALQMSTLKQSLTP